MRPWTVCSSRSKDYSRELGRQRKPLLPHRSFAPWTADRSAQHVFGRMKWQPERKPVREGWGGRPAHVLVGRMLHGGAQAVICESLVEGHIATGWKIDKVGTELHSPPEVSCWVKYAQNASYREGKVLLCVSNEG
jgi:hypothetical protein